jgi:hypothetical protein
VGDEAALSIEPAVAMFGVGVIRGIDSLFYFVVLWPW